MLLLMGMLTGIFNQAGLYWPYMHTLYVDPSPFGSQFYEGYGQTECTAGCTITLPGDWTAGTRMYTFSLPHTHAHSNTQTHTHTHTHTHTYKGVPHQNMTPL